jgi:hypothetical protein
VDHIVLFLLAMFGLLFLFLAQVRELLRQLGRTIDEWHDLCGTWRSDLDDEPDSELDAVQSDDEH